MNYDSQFTIPIYDSRFTNQVFRFTITRMKALLAIGAVVLALASGYSAFSTQDPEPGSGQEVTAYKAEQLRLPPTVVYDQKGHQLDFYNDLIKGKTVAVNFFYSGSNTIGPPMMATFRRVQQLLDDRKAQHIQLISISVDPETDTPERLLAYAQKFHAGPGWSFITGSSKDIHPLLIAFGMAVAQKEDVSPMILIGSDATHEWVRTYGLAAPSRIVDQILVAASRQAPPAKSSRTKPQRKRS